MCLPLTILSSLPEDSESLKAMVRSLAERDRERNMPKSSSLGRKQRGGGAEEARRRSPRRERCVCSWNWSATRSGITARARTGCSRAAIWRRCCSTSPRSWTASRFIRTMFRRTGAGRGAAAREAAQGPAQSRQFREPPRHHARSRVERGRARLPVLRRRAQGDRRGGELADRVLSRPLRAHPARAQEVRLPGLREQRRGRRSRRRPSRNRRSRRGWPGRGCWLTS